MSPDFSSYVSLNINVTLNGKKLLGNEFINQTTELASLTEEYIDACVSHPLSN